MAKMTLEYWEDEGWLVGRLVEVPGVFRQGETIDELKFNIREAYELMLESEPTEFFPKTAKRVELELAT